MRSRTSASSTMNTGKPVWSRKVNPRGAIHVGVATNSPSDGALKRAHQVIQESENGSMTRRRVSGRKWRTKKAVPPSYDPRCHSVDCRAVAMDPHSKHNIYPSTPSGHSPFPAYPVTAHSSGKVHVHPMRHRNQGPRLRNKAVRRMPTSQPTYPSTMNEFSMGDDADLQRMRRCLKSQSSSEWTFSSRNGYTPNSVESDISSTTTFSVSTEKRPTESVIGGDPNTLYAVESDGGRQGIKGKIRGNGVKQLTAITNNDENIDQWYTDNEWLQNFQ